MLKNKSPAPSRQTNSDAIAKPMPDPWLINNNKQEKNIIPETWHLPIEPYPLISAAGCPGAPSLVSHQSTSTEILLADELKLKTSAGSLFKKQLAKALALLYWVKTIS